MTKTPLNDSEGPSECSKTDSPCSLCSAKFIEAPKPTSKVPPNETEIASRSGGGFLRRLETDFELVGYDTICAMLAVDGRAPSRRTVMRHLRRHRDIVRPVKIGAHVGYPVEQILKFITRLKGKSARSETFL